MCADYRGTLRTMVLNTPEYSGIPNKQVHDTEVITVPDLNKELLSIDRYYEKLGYSIHFRQPWDDGGVSEMHNSKTGSRIPFRHDYVKGGFYMDYIPLNMRRQNDKQYAAQSAAILNAEHNELMEDRNIANTRLSEVHSYSNKVRKMVHTKSERHPMVKEIIRAYGDDTPPNDIVTMTKEQRKRTELIWAQHPDEREIKGVKLGLRTRKRKMPIRDFHEDHGHIGSCPGHCDICTMVKGNMRPIRKVKYPYKDQRVGFQFAMDMIVVSDRSIEKSKYCVVLKDKVSGYIKLLYLRHKSDAAQAVSEWIQQLRRDPLYDRQRWPIVQHIITDRDGAWSEENAEWREKICKDLGVTMHYISPDRHEENGVAE